ncbi:hypothetical protein [uncultured Gilvimarinus sp.]|uniref:hypothetical protein n=1 Tax=uncultured Gilvimarinus sp. TaxID=1689143 RepID=UPI0030EDB9BD|tara:strand:+ start:1228 stop:1875 length:648 start_codon:yes stop_codon:yes gene_type:complete
MTVEAHRLTSDIDVIFNNVGMAIQGVPYDLIDYHTKRALVEFCRVSLFWLEDIGPVRVVPATNTYDVPVSQYQRAISIDRIIATKGDDVKELQRSSDPCVEYRFWQTSDFSFDVYPHDRLVGYDLSVIAALEPVPIGSSRAIKVSQSVVDAWGDAISQGAIARIQKIPGKEWTDLAQSQYNEAEFMREARRARRQKSRGFSGAPDGAAKKPRKFF